MGILRNWPLGVAPRFPDINRDTIEQDFCGKPPDDFPFPE